MVDIFYEKFRILQQDGIEDLLQECLTHWYFNRHHYDESKLAALETYMSHVFENKVMDIIEKKRSQKRKAIYGSLSLDVLLEHADQEACGVNHPASDEEGFKEMFKSDSRDVLLRALERLSRRQRELCRLIQIEGLNLKQVSEKLNIPRTTLYGDVFRIREIFRNEGLKDYL